jgi:hypothetical protein
VKVIAQQHIQERVVGEISAHECSDLPDDDLIPAHEEPVLEHSDPADLTHHIRISHPAESLVVIQPVTDGLTDLASEAQFAALPISFRQKLCNRPRRNSMICCRVRFPFVA